MITDMTRSLEMVETQRLIYWTTMFGHRKCFRRFQTYTGVPGDYRNPPGDVMGLLGLSGEEEGRPGQSRAPSPSCPNWTRRGVAPPLFPSLPLSLPSLLLLQKGKEESYSRWE